MANSEVLPPNSTDLDRALVDATAPELTSIPVDFNRLWNPATCPIDLLPWLAWSLSIDRWDANWTEAQKRQAVAGAIAEQRRKGTPASVKAVLASFDTLLELVEWFETTPMLERKTFEVRIPLVDAGGTAGGTRTSAAVARAIVSDVTRTKPAGTRFNLVQQLTLAGAAALLGGAQPAGVVRLDLTATDGDPAINWNALLQDENGEPLDFGDGEFLEDDS